MDHGLHSVPRDRAFGIQPLNRLKRVQVVKLRLFVGGLLVGAAIGIMVGGALVDIPTEAGGKRVYPQGLALLLAVIGGVSAESTLRGSAPRLRNSIEAI